MKKAIDENGMGVDSTERLGLDRTSGIAALTPEAESREAIYGDRASPRL